MKMNNHHSLQNRNAVYHGTPEAHRSSMRALILRHLDQHGPSTRDQVAQALGKPIHQISGRFTALLKAGIIEETTETRPTQTGHQATVVRLKETN